MTGHLVNVDATNVNEQAYNNFFYISCDNLPGSYPGYLQPADLVYAALGITPSPYAIILYTEHGNHCNFTDPNNVAGPVPILTTLDPVNATSLANLKLTPNSPGNAMVLPDLTSFTNTTGGNGSGAGDGGYFGPTVTTQVAMLILYAVTGIITALFIVIIITGAIRAHRHPERYGPRSGISGRSSQSRAKGIARAMLETLPIVKFGNHTNVPPKPEGAAADIEMNPSGGSKPAEEGVAQEEAAVADQSEVTMRNDAASPPPESHDHADHGAEHMAINIAPRTGSAAHSGTHDGAEADGSLGCSICTEDFNQGEDVRVLPCNHKYHPECVDPWLLNVSGTCPLCRIDLRPQTATTEAGAAEASTSVTEGEGTALPPPLEVGNSLRNDSFASAFIPSRRRDTIASIINMRDMPREERIAALRRLRAERSATGRRESATEPEVDRRGLSSRLRERFRIRTTRDAVATERTASV